MKKILIVLGIIICLFGVFKVSQKDTGKNIPSNEMNDLLVNKDKIIKPDPELQNVYNFTYHIDNKKKIVYITPRDPYQLKDEMDELRTTPVGGSNTDNQTKSEKKFAQLSTQITQKYGEPWKVIVLNTDDPIFNDIRKSDILWEFQNGKEAGQGTQSGLFKLERILLTPFDYLGSLIGIIILGTLGWGALSLFGSATSAGESYRATETPHRPSYGPSNNNNHDDYVTETHYDQYGDAHSVRFKKGDYSRGQEGGRTFNMNPDGSYDSDDGNSHFDK